MKNGNKKRIGNDITDRAWVQVTFGSHFSFSRFPFLVLVPPS